MTKWEVVKTIFGLILFFGVIAAGSLGVVAGCQKVNAWNERTKLESEQRAAARAKYNARLPKVGDMVELNGKKIVILKEYFWSKKRTFRVRMLDGTITDVIDKELLDKEILNKSPE